MSQYHYEKDADGIVTVTMDAEGKPANMMTAEWAASMADLVIRLQGEEGLTGVVFASAKKTFFAGADLNDMIKFENDPEGLYALTESLKNPFRALEKLPVPVVAAINGAALGGGFEVCLAANYRVIIDDPSAVVGLPESQLGLLPGAGGVVRMVALIGLEAALPLLLEGRRLKPQAALKAGLVSEIVATQEELIPAAKAWIKANPEGGTQPWDQKGFRYPGGGATSQKIRNVAMMTPAMLYSKTRGLSKAANEIVDVAVNSMRMGFDSALRNETRGLVKLIPSVEAKAAITTFFFGTQAVKSGKFRPEGDKWKAGNAAILGAGMMGAGIAWAHASRGLPSVLKDMSLEAAEKGKSYSAKLADKAIKRGRMTEQQKEDLLGLISTADSEEGYGEVDLFVEAVFEDIDLKEKVIKETWPKLSENGIYGSNTSTLPISILAEACPDPSRFIGLHFFSPVDKMKIVEIIVGKKTSEETVRKAYDYVQQIGYTPIVVDDGRGFFTSRVFGTYTDEGQALLRDGVKPAMVERASWLCGFPAGPLAVYDEVSMVLGKKVHDTHVKLDEREGIENGYPADSSSSRAVGDKMIELGRGGRHYGGGFYQYHEDGTKSLWEGLSQFAERDMNVSLDEAKDRLMYRKAIETLRCFDEGVIRSETEGNIGSIFAIGFPAHTGGALQFIRGIGIDAFVARANALADKYGDRFRIAPSAIEKLKAADTGAQSNAA